MSKSLEALVNPLSIFVRKPTLKCCKAEVSFSFVPARAVSWLQWRWATKQAPSTTKKLCQNQLGSIHGQLKLHAAQKEAQEGNGATCQGQGQGQGRCSAQRPLTEATWTNKHVKQYQICQLHKVGKCNMVQRRKIKRMSEENGVMTHSITSPQQENQLLKIKLW